MSKKSSILRYFTHKTRLHSFRTFSIVFIVVISILLAIEILVSRNLIPSFLLPPPSKVIDTLISDFPIIMPHLVSTLKITLLGTLSAIFLALASSILMDRFVLVDIIIYPFVLVFQIVPFILFAPILIIWFGYGSSTQFIAVVLMVFFPLLVNIKQVFKNTPTEFLNLFYSLNANRWQIYRWLKLPLALSSICSGLKISITYAMTAAVISEWVGAFKGLGVLMIRSQKSFLLTRVFAINVLIVGISILLYLSVILLEKKLLPWKQHT